MAIYCISDIHGNRKALQALLVSVNFQYDGTDRLILLGDYVDWGPDSIETLKYVMRLDAHPFITCLMGNHDFMFLEEIWRSDCGRYNYYFDTNWLYNNRGLETWEDYLKLPQEEREEIRDWLAARPYSLEVQVGDRWYLLGHASPYLPEDESQLKEGEREMKQFHALWQRMSGPNVNPLAALEEKFEHPLQPIHNFDKFICGHSITYHYMTYQKDEAYRIFVGEHFIDIDCGAKCMGLPYGADKIPDDLIDVCRLGALRLEDMKEFYCDRKMAGYEVKES